MRREMISDNAYSYIKRDDPFAIFIGKFLPDKIDKYRQFIDNMEPDDELTKSLRNDDVDKLQLIVTANRINISDAIIPYNVFDDLETTLINYAAYYGSLKCFKYLLLNNGIINKETLYFAVYGGNIEIIQIVNQKIDDVDDDKIEENTIHKFGKREPGYSSDIKIISSAIKMHKNDLFDWLFENRFVNKGKLGYELNEIASTSALNGNAHALIEIIDKGYDVSSDNVILITANFGFYKLTRLLLSTVNQKN